ncbi:hypothetical protein [Kordia sp.]|uniref:hypothetical protein n=1 Tax=Kordia sp. TaxID=1965332 RepID=UPI003D2E3C27
MKKYLIICALIVFLSCKHDKKAIDKNDSIKQSDSIFLGENKLGLPTKSIYYPSKRKDSFRLRAFYVDGKLKDSSYITKNGFILGNRIAFEFPDDKIKSVYQYLKIDHKNFLNQYWAIEGKDTLYTYGNHYRIKFYDSIKQNKNFQVQIMLRKSYEEDFSSLFFLTPKEHYSVLKSDFSNYNEVEYDTIKSLKDDEIKGNETYDEYWSKRTIAFRTGFADKGINHIRGILVEQRDTLMDGEKNFIKRYLFVNEEVYVNE